MLVKLTLALLGGTVLSLIFGYLIAYWRDIGSSSPKNLNDSNWSQFFETLTQLKSYGLKFSARQQKQAHNNKRHKSATQKQRRSRAPSSWENHSEVQRLLVKFEDFYPELYRYFENLKYNGDELLKLEAKELESQIKVKVSASMMGDRMHELLELQAFDSFGVQGLGGQAVRELWLSFTVGQIYIDDARLGSSTLSHALSRELSLDESSLFRGIEAQVMLIKGASKKALFNKYWKEQQKSSFERSGYLQNLTPSQRAQLCYKWAQTKGHHSQISQQLKETLKEIEKCFQELYREHNSADGKHHRKKQQHKKSRAQRPSATQAPDSDPYHWAYELLEMPKTSDFTVIKKQFKKMAMKYHPDRLSREGLNELECRRHHEHFLEIQKAYKSLEKAYAHKVA